MGTSCSATHPHQKSPGQAARPLDVVGTIDVVSAFLGQEHISSRDAVQTFVKSAAKATGSQVHFYNCPFGRGRLTVVSGRPNSENEGFFLVASSSPAMQRGEAACLKYAAVLQDALDVGLASSGLHIAAAAVRSREGIDGILVVEAPAELFAEKGEGKALRPTLNGSIPMRELNSRASKASANAHEIDYPVVHCDNGNPPERSLAIAVKLWSQVLGERLENLHNRQSSQALTKALNSVLSNMEKVVDAGISGMECHAAMSHTSNMIPSEVLRGGIESDRVALWFYDYESKEVVLNNSGHLDGIRVPVDQSIVGDAVRVGTGRVICVPDVNQDVRFNRSVDQRTGFSTQSTICVPILQPRCYVERRSSSGGRRHSQLSESGKLRGSNISEGEGHLSVVQLTNGRRPGETGERIDHFDFVCAENIQRSELPTMLMLRDFFMQFLEMERQKEGLQAVVSLVSQADSVTEVITLVEQEVNDVMSCECCTFFFIDEANNEVWAPPTESRPKGICVSVGEGLVGHMAKLAQTDAEQCARMMTTNDPQTHPYWKGDIDTSFVTRNLMTAPVWSGGKEKRLMGLIQILNKRTATAISRKKQSYAGSGMRFAKQSSSGSPAKTSTTGRSTCGDTAPVQAQIPGFTPADEKLLQSLAAGVGSHLDRLLVDMMWTKAEMDTKHPGRQNQIPTSAMMNEYYSLSNKAKTVYRSAHPELAISAVMSNSNPLWISRTSIIGHDKECELLFKEQDPPDYGDVQQWKVDYWALSEVDEFRLFLQALRKTGCLSKDSGLAVEEYCLHNFFVAIRDSYRPEEVVPFHNFKHALSTMHFAFKIMTESTCTQVLNYESQYAILIAALCHDCDHRGCNNAFEIMSRSELALRYNDCAPLENHHCARTFEIALGSGATKVCQCGNHLMIDAIYCRRCGTKVEDDKAGNCNIFSGLNRESFVNVRQLTIAGILSTDMKHHGDHVALIQSFRLKDSEDKEQSQFLVECFLHSADISNPFMPPDISRRWAKLVGDEFTLQVTKERELGLPVTTFMDGLSDPTKAAKSQIGFVDFVIHPLVDPMFRIFEGLADCKRYLAENRAENMRVVEEANRETAERDGTN